MYFLFILFLILPCNDNLPPHKLIYRHKHITYLETHKKERKKETKLNIFMTFFFFQEKIYKGESTHRDFLRNKGPKTLEESKGQKHTQHKFSTIKILKKKEGTGKEKKNKKILSFVVSLFFPLL